MKIYVGNHSSRTTEESLKQLFEQFGEVVSVRIIKDRETGMPRGFAFVEMPNADEAQEAMTQLNNQPFEGQSLRVNEAREREERRPGAGRSFGGNNSRPYGSRPSYGSNGSSSSSSSSRPYGQRRFNNNDRGGNRGGFGQ